jgi:hypothetical protein
VAWNGRHAKCDESKLSNPLKLKRGMRESSFESQLDAVAAAPATCTKLP